MSRLPHLVWDMGGIMYRYFTEVLLDVGAAQGWPLEALALGPTGRRPDPDYRRLLEGEIDEPEYLRVVVARLREHGIGFDPVRDIAWAENRRDAAWSAIAEIHAAGHRQAVLTNDASRWLGAGWREAWEPARWFDAMVDVVDVGVRKPAPEPYLAAAASLGVPPGKCLFIDDLPVNCRGAEAVGMAGMWFDVTDPEGSLGRLRERVGTAG